MADMDPFICWVGASTDGCGDYTSGNPPTEDSSSDVDLISSDISGSDYVWTLKRPLSAQDEEDYDLEDTTFIWATGVAADGPNLSEHGHTSSGSGTGSLSLPDECDANLQDSDFSILVEVMNIIGVVSLL